MGSIRNFLYLSTLTLCVFFTAGAQGAMAQDFSFYRIDVEGNKRIEASTIVTYSGLATEQVFGADDLNRAGTNKVALLLCQDARIAVRICRSLFQIRKTFNDFKRHSTRRTNLTVVARTLCLCTPVLICLYFHFTHGVVFNSVFHRNND